MEILITGGAGFIGSHLAASISNVEHDITLLDLPGEFPESVTSKYKIIECDITETDKVLSLPRFDVIYHLAGQVGTAGSLKNLSKDLMWNSLGTLNIVQLAIKTGVKKLIFSSSMAVYGHAENAAEEWGRYPRSPYGISKVCAEEYVKYCQVKSPNTVCDIPDL